MSERIGLFALAEDESKALIDGLDGRPEGLIRVTPEVHWEGTREVGADKERNGCRSEKAVALADRAEGDCVANEQPGRQAHQTRVDRSEDVESGIECYREECSKEAEGDGTGIDAELPVEDDKE